MRLNWVAVLGLIAGGGLAGIVQAFSAAFPGEAKVIVNIAAIVVSIASVLYQLQTGTATSIAANAPVKDESGNTVATNISSTSTVFTKATT